MHLLPPRSTLFPYTTLFRSLGLKCGDEFPVKRGDVKRGGFTVSVAGKRRGKGSSREQSPYAEIAAGIKLAIAENIERIYKQDRKSTRLNSSHLGISYAVFCL